MKSFWKLIYNLLVVPLLYILIKISSLFNSKIRRGIRGRKRIFEDLIINAASLDKTKPLIWFHSSSLGEFEQAKPIIKELKKTRDFNILVTFFSPSGYENSLRYPYADLVSYIPLDSKSNAERFIQIVKPDLVVLMRYDVWPNHIWATKDAGIPSFLIDATMKKNTARRLPIIKNFHKYLFNDLSKILTVSKIDAERFKGFVKDNEKIKVVGDTRFDRVYEKSITSRERNLINEELFKDKTVFVAGSTWEEDQEIIIPVFKKLCKFRENLILIIAPHEPSILNLDKIEHDFAKELATIRFSYLNNYNGENVIIIDSIGILLALYTYADFAYVGGSFKQSIHNVLEPAVYGLPVIFGPKIDNSQEAQKLAELGGGIVVRNKQNAYRVISNLITNQKERDEKGKISYDYVQQNLGASKLILDEINNIM
ncbi:MAG TPA: 3-deoxy-D-manno-octulosonic acid transferase [Ignavibacteria bacterium]|nr:3-deoxy-D-manno-octulosonic acid transferase [Ignavibacteria bacterium]